MFHAQLLTLFPEFFSSPLSCTIPARAIRQNIASVECIQIRDFANDAHHKVDDAPYGGGPGMLLKVEPLVAAIREARRRQADTRVIMLTPSGDRFSQDKALEYTRLNGGITLLCGRYEGFDERITDYVDEQISLGDYVLSGGEPAALCILDAVIRLLPGVLGSADSAVLDSFTEEGLLDWPHYTRPPEFEGKSVPDVLLSGNHAAIEQWRKKEAKQRSKRRK